MTFIDPEILNLEILNLPDKALDTTSVILIMLLMKMVKSNNDLEDRLVKAEAMITRIAQPKKLKVRPIGSG